VNNKDHSSAPTLPEFVETWQRKAATRAVYEDFYDRLAAECKPGRTIEIGGGIGNLKQRLRDVVSTDIQFAPWLDCVADAQRIPFATGSVTNIVMVDVLHHLEFPAAFFREAVRVLAPGGRVLMVEPAMTWGSTWICRYFHYEPVVMSADSLADGTPDPARSPYDSNQAIATILVTRDRARFHTKFPALRMSRVDWFGFVAYPASGGFKPWSLLNGDAARRVLRLERFIERPLGRLAGFKMMIVIEKI
jgi:SAM-dependent methyltransferase